MPSILGAILQSFGLTDLPEAQVQEALRKAAAKVPDLDYLLTPAADALEAGLSDENKAALVPVLQAEIEDIRHGRFNPRDHASDA